MSLVKLMVMSTMLAHFQAGEPMDVPQVELPPVQQAGIASWYGNGKWHGEITANGEEFNPEDFTCAHRELPFNTMVLIENRSNGRRVWCRINDRGPYGIIRKGDKWEVQVGVEKNRRFPRVLDMSIATARTLGSIEKGLQPVKLRYWRPDTSPTFNLASLAP